MPVYNSTTKTDNTKDKPFVPGKRTAITLHVTNPFAKGCKKTTSVVTHTDSMHYLGYGLCQIFAAQGIDLTQYITPGGCLSKKLKQLLANLTVPTGSRKKLKKQDVKTLQKFLNVNAL